MISGRLLTGGAVLLLLFAALFRWRETASQPDDESHGEEARVSASEFESKNAELEVGREDVLRTRVEGEHRSGWRMSATSGPLDPLSKSRLASRFHRYYVTFTGSLHKVWADLGAASPGLDDFLEAAAYQKLTDRYSALAQMLANDEYWIVPPESVDIPNSGEGVLYTITSGWVEGSLVTVVFPIQEERHPEYFASVREEQRLKELSLRAFVDEFNTLEPEERRARHEAHRQATVGLQEKNARDSSPEELQKLQKQRFPRGTEYLEASSTLRVVKR